MRISDSSRFPHPVLRADSNDFASGEFDVRFQAEEAPQTGRLQLEYEVILTEPSIENLVTSGQARVGCLVRCEDTYYSRLLPLSWPGGKSDFAPGSLLNKVSLRPVVWLQEGIEAWDPGTLHQEFEPPVALRQGDVVAIAPEYVMSVGQAKFQPIESIFELRRSPSLEEGRIEIDPEGDRIGILAASETYDALNLLRGQAGGQPVMLMGVYLPAVMEVLEQLRPGYNSFEGYRWFRPFTARCDANGIAVNTAPLLETAQILLESPARALISFASRMDV